MLRNLLFLILLISGGVLTAQPYRLYGRITNTKLEPLAFVSVQLKNSPVGTLSKGDGTYELLLEKGRYELVFSIVGYEARTLALVVAGDLQQNLILELAEGNMSAVVVTTKVKDRATEIIRQVIRNKDATLAARGAYTCQLYIKAVQEDSATGAKTKPRKAKVTADSLAKAMNGMAMTEVFLRLDYESDQRIKEERLGIKKLGDPSGLFYLSVTDGNFEWYNNLLMVPALSVTPFLSPVSYSGLVAYRYKTLRIQTKGKYKHYTISIRPTKLSNATVEGELTVSDSSWTIVHTRFRLPTYHLPEYDFFEVEQHYAPVAGNIPMLQSQRFTYYSKGGRNKVSGSTLVHYKGYELNKQFGKRYFGPELSTADISAYDKDSSFWTAVRAAPLTEKEVGFIRFKDSVYRVTHSQAYLDSIDRRTNTVTWKKLSFSGQTFYDRSRERTWNLPPLVSLVQPFSFGGPRIMPSVFYGKTFPSRRNLNIRGTLSYGLRNRDVNGNLKLTRMYNPFNRGFYTLSAGRDFQFIFAGDAWINMLKRNNVFLNNFVGVEHGLELFNGFFLYADAQVAFRRSVADYKTGSFVDSAFADVLGDNQAVGFSPYNAVYGKLRLQYTPGQRYVREPREKIILGSKWPTFYTSWRRGVPGLFGSTVDFDYLEMGVEQELKMGLAGNSKYNVKSGSFLSQRDLRLVDYQFQRRGDPVLFLNPAEAFQSLDSSFALFKRFYQGHYIHEFNGFFLNRVPLLKKLGLREMAGGGFLIAPERNLRYAEAFAGVERIFKWPFNPGSKFKLGVYVVGSAANQFRNPVQVKFGITSWDPMRNRWF